MNCFLPYRHDNAHDSNTQPEAKGVNFPNAGQGESLLESCVFESWALSWRYGKEQFIILTSGQRKVHRVDFLRGCISAAGR